MSTQTATAEKDAREIAAQCGRAPRKPFRVAVRCEHDFPVVIVSPAVLEDGEPFPTCAWLTCPWLAGEASRSESAGEMARWEERAATDPVFATRLAAADAQLCDLRRAESGGTDACEGTGIAGRRGPGGIKCLHARMAAALIGIKDPVGIAMLEDLPRTCPDCRCAIGEVG